MKTKKRTAPPAPKVATPPAAHARGAWIYPLGCLVALGVVLQAYQPSLSAPFLFDDVYLPFNKPDFPSALRLWVGGVRPLLMFTYWVNYQLSGVETPSYHLVNVVLHAVNAGLVFLFLRKILESAGVVREKILPLAGFGGAIFLLHPVQTESVAYIASRSESLSALFFLAAAVVYLWRRQTEISWGRSAAVLLLFLAALASKEHTLVLPAVLLLTDYYWNPGFSWQGARRNWRFYVPVAVLGAAGLVSVWRVLGGATTAGFGLKDLSWYQYLFTQCRACFVYLRLFVFPVGQTVDYDFPVSRSLTDHGAVFGLAAIAVTLGAAVYFRRRYPLASYGWLLFGLLMAPTSSLVPLRDPIVEHRLYLPIVGLLLVVLEVLRRLRMAFPALASTLAAVAVLAGILTYQRNLVWADPMALWQDTVEKSPRKPRAHFQLAYAYYQQGQCGKAVSEYQAVAQLSPPSHDLLVDWGLAYDCLGRYGEALEKLQQAAALERSAHVYSQIAMVYAKQLKWPEALEALQMAEKLDPGYVMTYVYRGNVHLKTGEAAAAVEDYRRALQLDPQNSLAAQGLAAAQRLPAARR
jgi:tetratricopeptide (TPR) repeat protein